MNRIACLNTHLSYYTADVVRGAPGLCIGERVQCPIQRELLILHINKLHVGREKNILRLS